MSKNQSCHRVLRRSLAWGTYSVTPASPPPTSNPSSRSTPSPLRAAIGCSPRPPAAPAPTAPPSPRSWTSSAGRHPGGLEARSPRPLAPTLGRRGHGAGRSRRRVSQPPGGDRHHHPGGKLVFHVFAALAEFERDLIRERTSAGLAAARARGRHGGRPSVMTAHKLQVAREMYRSGQYTVKAIANTLGVSRASIYRHLTGSDRSVG
jgi:Resolvase, N terminal domain/Helix-turn-helix domain of resolvase